MNREEVQDRLADYLGDELSPEERRLFEEAAAADPMLAQEVAELREALAALHSLADPSRMIPPMSVAARRATPVRRPMGTLLRYAAMILLAFSAGFAARSLSGGAAPPPSITTPQPRPAGSPTGFEQRFAEAYGRSRADSHLARSFIALSRATR